MKSKPFSSMNPQAARLIDHEDLAVEARVQMRAVAVLRIQHDVFVLLGDVDDVQLDAELLGRPQRVVALRLACGPALRIAWVCPSTQKPVKKFSPST